MRNVSCATNQGEGMLKTTLNANKEMAIKSFHSLFNSIMKKIIIYTLLIIISFTNVYSQEILIKGNVYPISGKNLHVRIYKSMRNPITQSYDIEKEIIPNSINGSFLGTIKSPSALYFIAYGQESKRFFLEPKDTLIIDFKRDSVETINKPNFFTTKTGFRESTFISGNNKKRFLFFDSLELRCGIIKANSFISKPLLSDSSISKEKFLKSLEYLNDYTETNKLDSDFYKVVQTEIWGNYLAELTSYLFYINYSEFPKNFFRELTNETFKISKMSESRGYTMAAYSYLNYYLRREQLGKETKEQKLKGLYYNTLKYFSDESTKNFLLTNTMIAELDNNPDNYSFFFNKYLVDCTDKNYVNQAKELYKDFLSNFYEKNISLTEIHNTLFLSDDGSKKSLKEILTSKKPILFDFWASWCGPCLQQMEFSKILKKEYEGKVDFIYISVDQKESAWKKALVDEKLVKNQFLLKDGIHSKFGNFFKLNSIPRYILIKDFKIVKFKAEYPSNTIGFKKMLDAALK